MEPEFPTDLPLSEGARIRFPLGRIVATPGAIAAMGKADTDPLILLARHAIGDWGELCTQDREMNQEALARGGRLMSVYTLTSGAKLWCITEADRSATTLLLPEEY
jgi:hypothetical protein